MRRQKKFYAWGYADEDLSPDEIKPWEAEIAQRYGLSGFDVTPPPKADEITLRKPRVEVPAALQAMVRTDHLTRLEHSYGKAGFDALRMFMRSMPWRFRRPNRTWSRSSTGATGSAPRRFPTAVARRW